MERPTVVIELAADVHVARDLAAGGVFVPSCGLAINSDCDLVIRGASDEMQVPARVVFVDAVRGAGLELVGFGAEMRERLAALVASVREREAQAAAQAEPAPMTLDEDDAALDRLFDEEASAGLDDLDAVLITDAAPPREFALGSDASLELDAVAEAGAEAEQPGGDDEAPERKRIALNYHERLRGLTLAQQIKKANSNDPAERIMLERLYGKNVWEALLRNGKLTGPEVARIARMGTLPRPMLEMITGNGAWLQVPEIRRALLSNPRLGTDQIIKVLRMLPKHELKLAAVQTAYPHAVRDHAKRLLRENA